MYMCVCVCLCMGFPDISVGKEPPEMPEAPV